MIDELQTGPYASAKVTHIHNFAHRYPVERESLRDQQTWHAGVLLEWSHGRFVTLVELAWLNGCGGYGGKSNWTEDKLADPPALFRAMTDSMKCPWSQHRSEVRLIDMPLKSKAQFEDYLFEYSDQGNLPFAEQRFIKPSVYASGPVRVRNCTPECLAGYLLNYVHRARVYEQFTVNCQTFACDLFAFLAGAKDQKPFGAIIRPQYKQRSHAFLYKPNGMYTCQKAPGTQEAAV